MLKPRSELQTPPPRPNLSKNRKAEKLEYEYDYKCFSLSLSLPSFFFLLSFFFRSVRGDFVSGDDFGV